MASDQGHAYLPFRHSGNPVLIFILSHPLGSDFATTLPELYATMCSNR